MRVAKKLRNEEALITEYSGARLRMDLDRVPLWRGDHVTLKQLWSDYSQYLYLPRLRDSAVLLDAVRTGVALLTWSTDTFAYASAYDEPSGRYFGLAASQHVPVVLDATAVLVKPEAAARQFDEVEAAAGGQSPQSSGLGEPDQSLVAGPPPRLQMMAARPLPLDGSTGASRSNPYECCATLVRSPRPSSSSLDGPMPM